MDGPHGDTLDARLAEARWVRALARRLAGDHHRGEDLAQDALVAALERPAAGGPVSGPWLAGVMRKLAAKSRRTAARRAGREERVARTERCPSAAELVERAAAHRDLVKAVMRLREPYRAAILMRYLEELPPAAIAARQGVPVRTVHTRLARGLQELRLRLDRKYGDRRAWVALVAAPFRSATLPASSAWGLLAMKSKWTVAAAAVLLVSVGSYLAAVGPRWPGGGGARGVLPADRPDSTTVQTARPPAGAPVREAAEGTAADALGPSAPDLERDLHGVVVTPAGDPVAGAALRVIEPVARQVVGCGWDDLEQERATTRTDDSGAFAVRLEPGKVYDLEASAPGRVRARVPSLYAGEFVRVVLAAGAVLEGRVVDGAGARPVPGADVELDPGVIQAPGRARYATTTDSAGAFRLEGLPAGFAWLSVQHDAHPRLDRQIALEAGVSRRLELVLAAGAAIWGQVTDGESQAPIAGARVGLDGGQRPGTVTDPQGRYRLTGAMPNEDVTLVITAEGYGRWEIRLFAVAGEGLEQDVFLLPGRRAFGTVVDGAGAPVGGARVCALSDRRDGGVSRYDRRNAVSDGEGRFELPDLRVDSRHTLVVRAEGFATAVRDFPAVEWDGHTVDLGPVVLEPPASLAGTLVDPDGEPLPDLWVLLYARLAGRDALGPVAPSGATEGYTASDAPGRGRVMARSDARGRFHFADLPAGEYFLSAGDKGFARRGELEVELGVGEAREDLEIVLDVGLSIAGVVVDEAGEPVPMVSVSVAPSAPRDGAAVASRLTYDLSRSDGSFRLRGLDPGSYDVWTSGAFRELDDVGVELAETRMGAVRAGTTDLQLVVAPALVIRGTVVYPDGTPASGCGVFAVIPGQPASGVRLTDREGRFELPVPAASPVEVVAWPSAGAPGTTVPYLNEDGSWDESRNGRVKGVVPGTIDVVVRLPKGPRE